MEVVYLPLEPLRVGMSSLPLSIPDSEAMCGSQNKGSLGPCHKERGAPANHMAFPE